VHRGTLALAAAALVLACAGCTPSAPLKLDVPSPPRTAHSSGGRAAPPSPRLTPPTPTTTAKPPRRPALALPRAGRHILPAFRIVAYYGAPDGGTLGVLGRGTPDQAAAAIERQAAQYEQFGRPVAPAMELIATVAQAGPGRDGLYSRPIPDAAISAYLAAAHRHRLLLILDFQPGRGEFLPQVQRVSRFLVDPSVSVALDAEWKVGPNEVPARVIGSASAASINAVGSYVASLVARYHLPDKLLVVHQFTRRMLPDRWRIARPSGIEVVLHADGLATPTAKVAAYHKLAFPCPPFHAGFKLFFRADTGLMTPAQVMALRPQPEVVTYQ
jgi:hypothetical protein